VRALSSAFPEHRIVVRPHPSEDHAAWRAAVGDLGNVQVIHEGSALPWILASEVLIHNSCATGIEAAALNVPVIAYRPLRSPTYDADLPNAVSEEADSLDELLRLVRRLAAKDAPIPASTGELERRFAGLRGPGACARIVTELRQLQVTPRPFAATPLRAWARRLARRAWPPLRAMVRRVVRGRNPIAGYLEQKFPGLDDRELAADLQRLRRATGRFGGVQAVEIGEWLFALTDGTVEPERCDAPEF
jgi:hypothetical protein